MDPTPEKKQAAAQRAEAARQRRARRHQVARDLADAHDGVVKRALWESGKHAALDGVSALVAAGLTGWDEEEIDVSVPATTRVREQAGVRRVRLRPPVSRA